MRFFKSFLSCNVWDRRRNRRARSFTKSGGAPTRTTASIHFVQAILFVQVPVAGWRKGGTGSWKGQKGGERAEPEAGGRRGLTRMTGPGRATTRAGSERISERLSSHRPPPTHSPARSHANERSRRRTKLRGRPVYSPQVNYKYYLSSWFPLFHLGGVSWLHRYLCNAGPETCGRHSPSKLERSLQTIGPQR